LKLLDHKNIVKLEDVIMSDGLNELGLASPNQPRSNQNTCVFLVFEYVPCDLMGIVYTKPNFTPT